MVRYGCMVLNFECWMLGILGLDSWMLGDNGI